MTKKYELVLDDTIEFEGHTLFRVRSQSYFGKVEIGDLGGYVKSEKNLSHEGNAWVMDDAKVYDNAQVSGNAKVCENVWISGNTHVTGNAEATRDTWIKYDIEARGNI